MLNGGHAAAPVMQAADPTAGIREAYAREQAAANGGRAAPAPAPADGAGLASRVRVGATVGKTFPGYGYHRGTIIEVGADDVVVHWETNEHTTLSSTRLFSCRRVRTLCVLIDVRAILLRAPLRRRKGQSPASLTA